MNEKAASRASAMRCPGGRTAIGARARRSKIESAGQCENTAAIDMRLDEIGDRLEARFERLRLARLHQAQMALGQRDCLVARQRAHDRNAHRLDRLNDEPAMALAADAIDDDAGDLQPLVIGRAALDDRRRRLRLAGNVDDQQDRHAERSRDIGRGAGAPGLAGTPSNSPIEASHSASALCPAACAASAARRLGAMAQESRLTPSRPDAAAWKAGSI